MPRGRATPTYRFISNDITWCANDCPNKDCERNLVNRIPLEGGFSMARFKGTEMCPLNKLTDNKQDERKKENEQR